VSANKIVRTPTRAEGGITPEEKAKMDIIAQDWINVAMRTDPIEPEKIVPALEALYAAADLKKPRVVIVPSPMVMAFAYGAAAWIWHCRKNGAATSDATRAATRAATDAATRDATDAATDAATRDATRAATLAATYAATLAATYAATLAATYAATRDATYAATYAATRDAISDATRAATRAATDAATYAATRDAISDATDAATYAATRAATIGATIGATYTATGATIDAATYAATRAAIDAATRDVTTNYHEIIVNYAAGACYRIAGKEGLECAKNWWRSYQGGNMWAWLGAYISSMRDVIGLKLPEFERYQPWEDCARHGGFRVMHDEFCMVSDFPKQLHKDAENRPHNDSGPSHEWRDGWKLYHIHGVRVPALVVEHPEQITVQMIDAEENAEVRRIMIERYGQSRYLIDAGAAVLNSDDYGVLLRREVKDDEPIVMVRVLNSTPEAEGSLSTEEAIEIFGNFPVMKQIEAMRSQQSFLSSIGIKFLNIIGINEDLRWKDYFLRVPPDMNTAHEAVAWTFGMSVDEYHPDYQS